MAAYASRGVPLDLKSVLSNPNSNPHIDLKIPLYEESSRSFLKAVNDYKNRSITSITDRRAKEAAELKKMQDKAQKVEAETNRCKVQEIELMATLEREQAERKDTELKVAAFKRQLASLTEQCTSIQAQIDEYRGITAGLKTDKGKERSTLNSFASLVSPELEAFETLLSCVVEGLPNDQLLVRFTCVDMQNPDREFSFILDVSGDITTVIKTSPPVPSLPILLDKLHHTRDIFGLVVQIRQEFDRMANGDEAMNASVNCTFLERDR